MWVKIGGFLTLIGLLIALFVGLKQIAQNTEASNAQGTQIALLQDQLAVQRELLILQIASPGSNQSATEIALQITELESTASALKILEMTANASILSIQSRRCVNYVNLYIDQINGHSAGKMLKVSESLYRIPDPFFGNISFIEVPEGCRVILHDVVDQNETLWLGSTLELLPGAYALYSIYRDPSQTPWNTKNSCGLGLISCWNDSAVAIEVLDLE